MVNNFRKISLGFGLIEMMVSISIMILVISVVMANHNAFNGAVLLRSQAYDVALQVREVQLGAIGTMGQTSGFRTPYGVSFTEGQAFYLPFIDNDININYLYDGGEEYGKRGNLDKRFVIDEIRLINPNSSPSSLSVTFERPNFDAKFNTGTGVINASSAEIDVRVVGSSGTGSGKIRTVEILRTGQISVK